MAEKKRLTIADLLEMKKEKRKIVLLSVTDTPTANLAERAGVDVVILGDSLGMVSLGYSSTIPVTMEDMIRHGQAIRRGAPDTFLLAAMPYQSYSTPDNALRNATRFMQEVGADAVKIQGGKRVKHITKTLIEAGIPCFNHVGLTPHTIALMGGFKVQGRTADDAKRIYDDALAVQEAGAVGFEIEAIPAAVAEEITRAVDIVTFGIGAGSGCDGQILIGWDLLGLFETFKPKFVKRYASVAQIAVRAISEYAEEVRKVDFPKPEHTYNINEDELEKFKKLIGKAA